MVRYYINIELVLYFEIFNSKFRHYVDKENDL